MTEGEAKGTLELAVDFKGTPELENGGNPDKIDSALNRLKNGNDHKPTNPPCKY